jgi:hypothetical protein
MSTLTKLLTRRSQETPQNICFFADYLIWCWAWAIVCGDDENRGRVVVISGHDRFVADSFAQFVDLHISDPYRLL